MRFNSVIFDLDGTLIDSLADIGNAANRVLESKGLRTYDLEQYRHFVGDGVRVLFERVLKTQGISDVSELDACMESFMQVYDQHSTEQTRPYTGIESCIQQCVQRELKLGVLSNKPDVLTKKLVAHFFGDLTFSPVFGQRANVPKKPDPTAVYEIAASWEVSMDCIAYVGDTNTDMNTARNAGCFAIGVTWGFRSKEELLQSGAQAIADHPDQLLDLIATC